VPQNLTQRTPKQQNIVAVGPLNHICHSPCNMMIGSYKSIAAFPMTDVDRKKCLQALRGNSDEEKLVGLFLLLRCARTSSGDDAFLLEAWRALRTKFLIRMLKTDGGIECVYPLIERTIERLSILVCAGADDNTTYRGLALNIVSFFSSNAAVVRDAEFLKLMATIAAVLPKIDVANDQFRFFVLHILFDLN
jgi:hypothetical protein